MPKAVIMPKFGFTQEESTLVTWLVKQGDHVDQGDPICEVTTDKINMEVEAPVSGILDGILYHEGDTVPVTEVIAFIRSEDEAPLTTTPATPPPSGEEAAREKESESRATPVAANLAKEKGVDLDQVPGTGPGGRVTRQNVEDYLAGQVDTSVDAGKVRAVPSARRLAREAGIELSQIKGTGPNARIQTTDVRGALERPVESVLQAIPSQAAASVGIANQQAARAVPLAGMRLTIATRMQKSSQEAPHITFEADVDATNAEALRVRANELLEQGQPRISLTAIIVKACAWALKRNPFINSRLDGSQILLLDEINIGIAVALEEGLIVPVVHGVAQKGIAQVAVEIAGLAERARSGHLHPDDVTGGTFTISNLGMFGVDRFTAIINPPESAILAIGRITRKFVPDDQDRPVVRPVMTVTLSADHRVVDGALAAQFIRDVRLALEHPDLMSL